MRFSDKKTQPINMKTQTEQIEIKPASVGSISHGTLRTEDLLEAFGDELEWQIRRNGEYFSRPENFAERNRLNAIHGEYLDCYGEDGETIEPSKEETANELVNETLPDALQSFCLPYFYFGAHFGDGSDFGFWPDDIENIKEQVGFVSSREQEYPDDDFLGEWLHINERGNCTLYVRENVDKDRQIWALV